MRKQMTEQLDLFEKRSLWDLSTKDLEAMLQDPEVKERVRKALQIEPVLPDSYNLKPKGGVIFCRCGRPDCPLCNMMLIRGGDHQAPVEQSIFKQPLSEGVELEALLQQGEEFRRQVREAFRRCYDFSDPKLHLPLRQCA